MSHDDDKRFVETVKRQLDQHADQVDELTLARLKAIRRTALDQTPHPGFNWLPVGVWGTAAAAVLALVIWHRVPEAPDFSPGDLELLAQVEDLELIEELEFYAWLEESESNS